MVVGGSGVCVGRVGGTLGCIEEGDIEETFGPAILGTLVAGVGGREVVGVDGWITGIDGADCSTVVLATGVVVEDD